MVHESEITIIGAGVIGLAIAAELSGCHREVLLLEKNRSFGLETSSRNSEVIHAGIYYPNDSLKAKTCVEGKHMLYELCQREDLPYKRIGKLIVATNDKETGSLESLMKNGENNSVSDLRMLSKNECLKLEPNVTAQAAILSPSSGIVDAMSLMRHHLNRAKSQGCMIAYNSKVIGFDKTNSGYKVATEEHNDIFQFITKIIINCAGLDSGKIAELAGMNITDASYVINLCKGEYFSVGNGKNTMIQRLVYPVPPGDAAGLGIHATLCLDGRMRLGPNARYVDEIDYTVDIGQKEAFYQSVVQFLPFIKLEDIEPEMAGIRPKLEETGGGFRDFVISHEHDKGLPGLINLIGIESPGLTASPAIARYVANMVNEILS
jgi:L-2-hydroxyglutarate oxidase LhgO